MFGRLVFPGKDKAGNPLVDTSKRDKLTLVLKGDGDFPEARFTWRTPLDGKEAPGTNPCQPLD